MSQVKVKTEKGLVKRLWKIRDKMNQDIQDMTFDEIKDYLRKLRNETLKAHC